MMKFDELDDLQKAAAIEIIKYAANAPQWQLGKMVTGGGGSPVGGFFGGAGRQISSAWGGLKGGISKDIGDIGENIEKTWARRAKESPYGNFANIGPLIPAALGLTWGIGSLAKGGLGRLFRRGR